MIRVEDIVNILREQVRPALGCTEPVAVAVAVSRAYAEIGGQINSIYIEVTPNIYKNGMRVMIPGTCEKGLHMAAALGAVCGDWRLGLEVFRGVTDEFLKEAKRILTLNMIRIKSNFDVDSPFYICAEVKTDNGYCICIIEDCHTNISYIEKNNEQVFKKTQISPRKNLDVNLIRDATVKGLRQIIEQIPIDELEFLLEGANLNLEVAEWGLEVQKEENVGYKLQQMIHNGILADDVVNRARVVTASAAYARMSGVKIPVMSSAGSGNHGITATLPVLVVAEHLRCSNEVLIRTLALSHIVTILIKTYTGRLSPMCGCGVAAGVGASAGISWLLGGDDEKIAGAIKNMIGNLTGIVCDGAKKGCAWKLSTAAAESVLAAQLAISGTVIPDFDGIIGKSAEMTIKNLGKLCNNGMKGVDEQIIEIMSC